ncbi:hypothetical protein QBC45DRAFT_426335 [Copromyces sp. CBS 386.78]|nr:hypothetical protein QBC45DRAFT_426335 [Copromyces sp. CBS 386.78]
MAMAVPTLASILTAVSSPSTGEPLRLPFPPSTHPQSTLEPPPHRSSPSSAESRSSCPNPLALLWLSVGPCLENKLHQAFSPCGYPGSRGP